MFRHDRERTLDERVGEVMETAVPTIPAGMKVTDYAKAVASNGSPLAGRPATLIVDEQGNLAGIITQGDLIRSLERNRDGAMTVLEAGKSQLLVAHPDDVLHRAVSVMLQNNIGRLPVVERHKPRKIVGYLGRTAVMSARLRRLEEEHVRERGWGWCPRQRDAAG